MIKRNRESGFTLIEIIVTAFVFSIIALAVSGLFVNVLRAERRAFALQKIQENGLFIMESMSREIRVSQIQNQDSPTCALASLTILHPVNGTVVYALSNTGVLQRTANGVTTDISSPDIKFSKLSFCVLGSGPTDQQQTRVTIIASIQNNNSRDVLETNFQTTVSSRDVSTEF